MKRNITSVSYGRTISLGNYETARIDLTARLDEGDKFEDVISDLECELLKMEKRLKKNGMAQ